MMRWSTKEDLFYRRIFDVRPILDNQGPAQATGRRDGNGPSNELYSMDQENGEAQKLASPIRVGIRYQET